jgi:hypothetical protein
VSALRDVGCPEDLALRLVDRHAVLDRDPVKRREVRVRLLTATSGWLTSTAPEDAAEAARDVASQLFDANRQASALRSIGEPVEALWPLRQARSGKACPESGLWEAPEVGAKARPFELGSVLPHLSGAAVTWHLLL